ncbi:hypothetical protein NVP1242O_50 [Vibrio phage 1.242.O._10N.261.54.B2]|nr:hypothetical protein NVP1242O_50 [Vibrio phage 1.242.O._10N.261.54.B2]
MSLIPTFYTAQREATSYELKILEQYCDDYNPSTETAFVESTGIEWLGWSFFYREDLMIGSD